MVGVEDKAEGRRRGGGCTHVKSKCDPESVLH